MAVYAVDVAPLLGRPRSDGDYYLYLCLTLYCLVMGIITSYTRARAGNIGVCIGTSGPAGTDMVTGLYSASADSIPILCITGQAPRAT